MLIKAYIVFNRTILIETMPRPKRTKESAPIEGQNRRTAPKRPQCNCKPGCKKFPDQQRPLIELRVLIFAQEDAGICNHCGRLHCAQTLRENSVAGQETCLVEEQRAACSGVWYYIWAPMPEVRRALKLSSSMAFLHIIELLLITVFFCLILSQVTEDGDTQYQVVKAESRRSFAPFGALTWASSC